MEFFGAGRRFLKPAGPTVGNNGDPVKLEWRDHTIRALLILGGAAAAAVFILKGEAEALPFMAFGGALGATLMHGASRGPSES